MCVRPSAYISLSPRATGRIRNAATAKAFVQHDKDMTATGEAAAAEAAAAAAEESRSRTQEVQQTRNDALCNAFNAFKMLPGLIYGHYGHQESTARTKTRH